MNTQTVKKKSPAGLASEPGNKSQKQLKPTPPPAPHQAPMPGREQDNVLRPFPHALFAEKSTLSTILKDGAPFVERAIESGITPEHYYDPGRATLFEFICARVKAGLPIDLETIFQDLLDQGKLDRIGGQSAFTDIYTYSPSSDNFDFQIKALKDKFVLRSLLNLFHTKKESVYDSPDEVEELLSEVERTIATIRKASGAGPVNLSSQLESRAFDFDEHPAKPVPLIQLCGMALCTPGNIMNVQALPKAGKSAVVESKIAAIFNGNRQGPDTLGFSAVNNRGFALIHFDTEQSRYDHDALVRRAVRRAGILRTPEWFLSYSVADLDIRDRRLALRHVMHEARETHGGIFAVMIDGIGDLCGDPNDSEEAFDLVHELHALAITYDCAIVTVLHENPGSETGKTRGHLGSQLERKAETNLRLAKDATGITTMWAERARHCYLPKEQGPCFSWNDQAAMHTSCGTAGEIKSAVNRERLQADAVTAFGGVDSFRHVDLLGAVRGAFDIGERAAKDRVRKWAIEGVILKNSLGKYQLANP